VDIYLDEAGIFTRPKEARRAVSCLAALVIPTSQAPSLLARFQRIRDRWGPEEAKGRALSEKQVADVINLCRRYEVLLEITGTDLNQQSASDVAAFKLEQGARLEKHITPSHQPTIRAMVADRRRYLEGMTDQLFIQAMLTISLIDDVLRDSITYYALRLPAELGSFRWRVDAKDANETEAEALWRMLLMPMLQTTSFRNPHALIREGDYSHFKKFEASEIPEYVREYARADGVAIDESGASGIDLQKVVRGDFRLCDSRDELGLQLVDVLGAAVRRAMMGTLRREGWKKIGCLMVSLPRMSLLTLPGADSQNSEIRDSTIASVMIEIDKRLKRLVPSRFTHR
jgi:hypothetical protein